MVRTRSMGSWRSAGTCSQRSCLGSQHTTSTHVAHSASERIVKEDVYTSIHIDEFDIGARDTKLGPEEITRDIPNVGKKR